MPPTNFEVRDIEDLEELEGRLGARAAPLLAWEPHAWRAFVPVRDYPGWWVGVDWFVHGDPVDVILGIAPPVPWLSPDLYPRALEFAGATILAEGSDGVERFDLDSDDLVVIPAGADVAALSRRIRRVARRVQAHIGTCLSCGQRRHLDEQFCDSCWAIKNNILY